MTRGHRDLAAAAVAITVGLWASSDPALLYPVYQARWGLDLVANTALFATYPLVLIVGLLCLGGLSDSIGRRRAMSIGLTLVAVGAALNVTVHAAWGAYLARAVQGFGVSIMLPAAAALLVESLAGAPRSARLASTVNASSTATGTVVAFVVGGWFSDHSSDPASTAHWPLLVASSLTALSLARRAPDAGRAARRFAPAPPRVPAGPGRRPFLLGTIACSVGYSVAALFLSLGAHIGREIVHTPSALTEALLLSLFPLANATVPWLAYRLSESASVALGGVVAAVGLVSLVALGAHGGSIVFAVAAFWCGAGFSLLNRGGTALVQISADDARRAGALAAMSVAAYLTQASTALLAGATSQRLGLQAAISVYSPAVALTALTAAGVVLTRRARARASTACVSPSSPTCSATLPRRQGSTRLPCDTPATP